MFRRFKQQPETLSQSVVITRLAGKAKDKQPLSSTLTRIRRTLTLGALDQPRERKTAKQIRQTRPPKRPRGKKVLNRDTLFPPADRPPTRKGWRSKVSALIREIPRFNRMERLPTGADVQTNFVEKKYTISPRPDTPTAASVAKIKSKTLAKRYMTSPRPGFPRAESSELSKKENAPPETPRFVRLRKCSTRARLYDSDIDFVMLANDIARKKVRKKKSPRKRRGRKYPEKPTARIFAIMGAIIVYDLRGFTYFCNICKKRRNEEAPARLMMNIYTFADKFVYKWDGEVISRTGDGFVAIFPRTKTQNGFVSVLKKAFQCSLELTRKTDKLLKKLQLPAKPERCGIGIDVGPTLFFKNNRFKNLTPISAVSSTINNAQRCDAHSKKLFQELKEYRPIAMKKAIFNILKNKKRLQRIFREKDTYNKTVGRYLIRHMNEMGIPAGTQARTCPFENIIRFYKRNRRMFQKRQRKLTCNLKDLFN